MSKMGGINSRRASAVGLILLAAIATSGASVAPAAAADVNVAEVTTADQEEVLVFAYCNADGSYSYNAVGHGYTPGQRQPMYAVVTSYWIGGGYTSGTIGHGSLYPSASGYITTPTYYSQANSTRETVSVKFSIGGASGVDSASCD
ncbi:hypothetical protein [Microbacterium hydrocarbonoxydans]|uniref:hypothetical protein n=1 Tax=Microbacterium hydrocarbonoxydans TaxID=273678 RepID=UPI003D95D477